MELLKEIEKFINKNNLIEKDDKIVLGVSGGPDSLCLLYILNELKSKYNLSLIVAHVNHMLRVEADFEENFVKETASILGLPFFSKKVNILEESQKNKQSTEEYARNIRYNFFEEIRVQQKADKIAVAHNLNDCVETTLMNIIRGSGIEGLTGIYAKSDYIIRPLLNTQRVNIEEYCKEKSLVPMIDKTNLENIYTRNKIRNEVLPKLKEINPDVVNSVNRLNNIIREENELIEEIIIEKYKNIRLEKADVILNKEEFNKQNMALKRRIIRNAVMEFRGNLKNITFSSIENALGIIEKCKNGDMIKISDDTKILVNYNELCFVNSISGANDYIYELNIPGKTYIKELDTYIECEIKDADKVPNILKEKYKKFFDIAKTGKKLYVRNRKKGDVFSPTGMTGTKKIKDFFSDNKVETGERDRIPLIVSGDEVIWVVGFRSSRKFLKDKDTKEVIILKYGKNI